MKVYSNAYDYAMYMLNDYEDEYFISLFAHFKHKGKYIVTARLLKYMYNQNTYVLRLFFMRTLL